MNSSTLYTYEIYDLINRGDKETANALWKSLPDFTNGSNALVIADVSGSMYGRPMSVSVSLALYFAERNKGTFNNYFMTFSSNPTLQKVYGDTLEEKMNSIQRSDWGMSTNLQASFDAILSAAVDDMTPKEQMPKILYIISDMQFDRCGGSNTNFEEAKSKFNKNGYELPHIVFWNVNSKDDSPSTMYDNNVTLISGSSQSTFSYAVEGKTPIESMIDILNSERYSKITM